MQEPKQPVVSLDEVEQVPEEEPRQESEQTSEEEVKRQLTEIYQQYNPSKLSEIDNLVEKYRGDHDKLLRLTKAKYEQTSSQSDANRESIKSHLEL